MVQNQLEQLKGVTPTWDLNMAREAGILWTSADFDESTVAGALESMSAGDLGTFEATFNKLKEAGVFSEAELKPMRAPGTSRARKVMIMSDLIQEYITAEVKTDYPKNMNKILSTLTNLYASRLRENKPLKIISGGLTPSQFLRRKNAAARSVDPRTVEVMKYDGIGSAMAMGTVETWRNGGTLTTDRRLFADPRTPAGRKATEGMRWMNMQVKDVSVLTNSLFGSSRLIEAHHASFNQDLIGARGMGFMDVWRDTYKRIEQGLPVATGRDAEGNVAYSVIPANERKAALGELQALKDQYDTGIGRLPDGVTVPSQGSRNINALIRMGTTIGSAPNWIISSLAETTQLVMQTMVRTVLMTDLKAFTDFIRPLSRSNRKQLYENVNMFHNQYDRHNIGIQTGQWFLGDISDLDAKAAKEETMLESLDGWMRWVATLGFGKMNRYNRYVAAARASRDLKKIASKPGFMEVLYLAPDKY